MNMHSPISAHGPTLSLAAVPRHRRAEHRGSRARIEKRAQDAAEAARKAAAEFPALAELVASWCAISAVEVPLGVAHNLAECTGDTQRIEEADEAWHRELDRLGTAAVAILRHPVRTAAEAAAKQEAFAAVATYYDPVDDEDEIAALRADLQQLADLERRAAAAPVAAHSEFALARQAYEAAEAAYEACDPEVDEAAGDPLAIALAQAQDALEEATPTNLTDLAYSIRAALKRELHWIYQDVDSPDHISDLLGAPGYEGLAARTYLAVLELAGIDHPVREASFGPSFDEYAFDDADEREAAYRKHHALRRAVQKAVAGPDGRRASWKVMRDAFDFAVRTDATPDDLDGAALSKATVRSLKWPDSAEAQSAAA